MIINPEKCKSLQCWVHLWSSSVLVNSSLLFQNDWNVGTCLFVRGQPINFQWRGGIVRLLWLNIISSQLKLQSVIWTFLPSLRPICCQSKMNWMWKSTITILREVSFNCSKQLSDTRSGENWNRGVPECLYWYSACWLVGWHWCWRRWWWWCCWW